MARTVQLLSIHRPEANDRRAITTGMVTSTTATRNLPGHLRAKVAVSRLVSERQWPCHPVGRSFSTSAWRGVPDAAVGVGRDSGGAATVMVPACARH